MVIKKETGKVDLQRQYYIYMYKIFEDQYNSALNITIYKRQAGLTHLYSGIYDIWFN